MKPFIVELFPFNSLSKNRINQLIWSTLEEIIRYLNSVAFDHKSDSLHFSVMAPKTVRMKYSSDIITPAFEYYATSWSLYNKIFSYYHLQHQEWWHQMFQNIMLKLFLLSLILLMPEKMTSNSPWLSKYIKNMYYLMTKKLFGNRSLPGQTVLGIMS